MTLSIVTRGFLGSVNSLITRGYAGSSNSTPTPPPVVISLATMQPPTVVRLVTGPAAEYTSIGMGSSPITTVTVLVPEPAAGPDGSVQFAESGVVAAANGFTFTSNKLSVPALSIANTNVPISEVVTSLASVTLPGLVPANTRIVIMPIVQPTIVPANFGSSNGYAFTNAAADAAFAVSYIRSGSVIQIGNVTFTNTSSRPTMSTQAQANLVSGDVFLVITPSVADITLADVGLTIVLLKSS